MLWQTASWLMNEHHAVLGTKNTFQLCFILYSLSGAAGLLLGAFLCDRVIRIKMSHRSLAAVLSLFACALTALRFFVQNFFLFGMLLSLACIFGFAAHSVLLSESFRKIPYALRALSMGLTLSLCVLLRFPADLYAKSGTSPGLVYLLLSVSAGLLLSLMFFCSPLVKQVFEAQAQDNQEKKRPDARRLIGTGILCSLFLYTLHGIFDANVNGTFVYELVLYFRVLQIAVPVIAGLLCYRFGYTASVMSSLCLAGFGVFCYYFSYSNIGAAMFAMAGIAALSLFFVPIRAMFADISFFSKYPSLVTSLSFITFFLFQALGWPISTLLEHTGKEIGFVLYLCIFIFSVPAMLLFFYSLVQSYLKKATPEATSPPPNLLRSLQLTRREEEIFLLILQGVTMEEISQNLFLSDATVKWHLSNILKKTGVKNRAALIERFRELYCSAD